MKFRNLMIDEKIINHLKDQKTKKWLKENNIENTMINRIIEELLEEDERLFNEEEVFEKIKSFIKKRKNKKIKQKNCLIWLTNSVHRSLEKIYGKLLIFLNKNECININRNENVNVYLYSVLRDPQTNLSLLAKELHEKDQESLEPDSSS